MICHTLQRKNSNIILFKAVVKPVQLRFTTCQASKEIKTENTGRETTLFYPLALQLCVVRDSVGTEYYWIQKTYFCIILL